MYPSTLWAIPELAATVLEELPRKDLVNTVTVSRFLWDVAAPLIWVSIDVRQLGILFDIKSKRMQYNVSFT